MPICYITVSDKYGSIDKLKDSLNSVRDIVADGLDSKSRLLDRNHIAVRIQASKRDYMLADIEIDIFAQFFWRRFFSRDRRANKISKEVSNLLNADCAAWINLCQVGYSRHTITGEDYFSIKADDLVVLEKRKNQSKLE